MTTRNHNNFHAIFARIFEKKIAFFTAFFAVLLVSYGFLYAIDFIPEKPEPEEVSNVVVVEDESRDVEPVAEVARDPIPARIIIDALDKDIQILNPESRAVADLDNALLRGVVRHPDSANLADNGNMFLFGHSSYLPSVINKNFQAFNGIQNLEWGDIIRVQSTDTEYIYRVQRVYKTLASEATVVLDHTSSKLTLATCNSFGSKDDRFIVEANLIETRPL